MSKMVKIDLDRFTCGDLFDYETLDKVVPRLQAIATSRSLPFKEIICESESDECSTWIDFWHERSETPEEEAVRLAEDDLIRSKWIEIKVDHYLTSRRELTQRGLLDPVTGEVIEGTQ